MAKNHYDTPIRVKKIIYSLIHNTVTREIFLRTRGNVILFTYWVEKKYTCKIK